MVTFKPLGPRKGTTIPAKEATIKPRDGQRRKVNTMPIPAGRKRINASWRCEVINAREAITNNSPATSNGRSRRREIPGNGFILEHLLLQDHITLSSA